METEEVSVEEKGGEEELAKISSSSLVVVVPVIEIPLPGIHSKNNNNSMSSPPISVELSNGNGDCIPLKKNGIKLHLDLG